MAMDENNFHTLWGTGGANAAPEESGTRVLDTKAFDSMWFAEPKVVKAEKAKPVVTKPGVLANAEHEGVWGALKNIATGAVRGAGDIAGAVGNTAHLADYLLARGESAITGKPLEDVQASFAEKKAKAEANPTLLSSIHSAIAPENVMPSGQDVSNRLLNVTGEYVPTTQGQKLAQAGMQAVVGSVGPGFRGAPAPVNNLIPNIIRQSPMVGATGALAQGVTDLTGDPLLGMASAAAFPAVVRGTGSTVNRLVGTVDDNTAALAQTARDQFGIPVGAGEVSSNPTVRFLNSVVNKLPGSGGGGHRENMQVAFNRSIAETFGENAERITPQVMARARDRIGGVFEDVANRTPTIQADPQFALDLRRTIRDAQATMTAGEVEPLIRQVQNIAGLVDPRTNTITGEVYQNLTRRGTPLDRAMQSQNPNIRGAARDIREALDDVMERSATPEAVADLRQARAEWRNLRTVEPLVAKAPTGDISPALLQGRVNTNFKGTHGAAYGGGGDLKTLADIGQRFMKEPPSSGTAERGMLMHLLGGFGSGVAGLAAGLSPKEAAVAMLAPVGGAAVGRGVGAALRSESLTNRLINNSLGNPTQTAFGNYVLNSTLPVTVEGNNLLRP